MRNSLNGPLAGFGLVLAGAMAGVMALPIGAALAFERPLPQSSTAALVAGISVSVALAILYLFLKYKKAQTSN